MPENIPAEGEVTVVIARTVAMAHAANLDRPFVAVVPNFDDWNDYGLRLFAHYVVGSAQGPDIDDGHFRMMVEGQARTATALIDALGDQDIVSVENIGGSFVSLFPDTDQYRDLVSKLGFGPAMTALRRLGDAVILNIEESDPHLLELTRSEEFHLGVLRMTGSYAALQRGSRYFRPTPPPEVEDAAHSFTFSTTLPSADNEYSIDFNFEEDPIFQDRAAVLIGKNGTGKTKLLRSMISGLTEDVAGGHVPPITFDPEFQATRVLVFSSVPNDPFPRHIGAWHGIDYEYFAIGSQSNHPRDDGTLAALASCLRGDRGVQFGDAENHIGRMDLIKLALDSLGLWTNLHVPLVAKEPEDLPHVIVLKGLKLFPIRQNLNEQNTLKLIQRFDYLATPIVLDDDGDVMGLSSGEMSMLRLAVQMAAAIEPGCLLLLDEPENHLHPNFVSQAMELLHQVLSATKSVAIVATHSAYIVREVPRQRVHILTLEDREITIASPRLQTFGASVDTISQFVFGDTSIDHRYQRALEKWALTAGRAMGIEQVIAEHGKDLNPESLSLIASTIQDADGD
ncbi:AAA family ATPase [Rhizobium laguerreae]|uniref:AAA family ATPase n=1 Tax=Rhizobium laguerreae TaxID=1076926 RepID=UPI001C910E6B|nr:AAA family ATPase [Rhizobium laguerreae]MBY3201340.1 AAA family ATPase [Rhizobium laguerreae]